MARFFNEKRVARIYSSQKADEAYIPPNIGLFAKFWKVVRVYNLQ